MVGPLKNDFLFSSSGPLESPETLFRKGNENIPAISPHLALPGSIFRAISDGVPVEGGGWAEGGGPAGQGAGKVGRGCQVPPAIPSSGQPRDSHIPWSRGPSWQLSAATAYASPGPARHLKDPLVPFRRKEEAGEVRWQHELGQVQGPWQHWAGPQNPHLGHPGHKALRIAAQEDQGTTRAREAETRARVPPSPRKQGRLAGFLCYRPAAHPEGLTGPGDKVILTPGPWGS